MPEQAIRFGVRGPTGMRAATWKCWTPGASKHDVYLACRRLKGELKASLHQSGRWHIAFSQPFYDNTFADEARRPKTRFTDTWPRPSEIAPGITLAFRIVVPWFSATVPQTVEEPKVTWIPSASEHEAVEVYVLICAPQTVTADWPGKRSMGTSPVGSLRLATGEIVWIVSRRIPFQIPPKQQGNPTFFKGVDRSELTKAGLHAICFGDQPDGSRVMYDVPVRVRSNAES